MRRRHLAFVLALASLACILWSTSIPGEQKNQLIRHFPRELHIDKVGHFCGFGLFAATLLFTERLGIRTVLAIIVVVAAGTEVMQMFIDGRSAGLLDVLIDVAGGSTGLLIAWRLRRRGASRADGRS